MVAVDRGDEHAVEPERVDLVRTAEGVPPALDDVDRHARPRELVGPGLLRPAGRVQRERQAEDAGRPGRDRRPAGDPGPGAATADDERAGAGAGAGEGVVRERREGGEPAGVEPGRRRGDPAAGDPPRLLDEDGAPAAGHGDRHGRLEVGGLDPAAGAVPEHEDAAGRGHPATASCRAVHVRPGRAHRGLDVDDGVRGADDVGRAVRRAGHCRRR